MHEDLARAIERELRIGQLTRAYGMTESTAIISESAWDDPFEDRLFTDGTALPDTELRAVDPETLTECSPGAAGGSGSAASTSTGGTTGARPRRTSLRQGWFGTGDLGTIDAAGRVRVVGRIKDMYKTGGFNVYPVEIEDFLMTHPAVEAVAVVGVPEHVMGEVGVAFVQLEQDAGAAEEEIRQFCAGKIANYKAPRHVRIVPELPTSHATLEIQKHLLREHWVRGG